MQKKFLSHRVFVFITICLVLGSLLVGLVAFSGGFSCAPTNHNESDPIQYTLPKNH